MSISFETLFKKLDTYIVGILIILYCCSGPYLPRGVHRITGFVPDIAVMRRIITA